LSSRNVLSTPSDGTAFTAEETAALERVPAENDAWIVFNGHVGKVAFGEYLARLIFTNEPEDRLREAGRCGRVRAQAAGARLGAPAAGGSRPR
jgi:hypothetical protein